jgi:carboxylesterase type B
MHARSTPLLLLACVAGASARVDAPHVTLPLGNVSGGTCNTTSSDAASFLGIPYAKPPTGALRFQPPVAFDHKYGNGTGWLDATSRVPACIQFGSSFVEDGPQSEDWWVQVGFTRVTCRVDDKLALGSLYLDVYTPRKATSNSSLPVKVFIYGGSDVAGGISDLLYDGCDLAASDAVFVSINYRLGPLGWLVVNGSQIPGNMALQDIVLGLQWVQDNIKAFGGDPVRRALHPQTLTFLTLKQRKVLLFGQSSGAYNSWAISTLPQAPKLINAVAQESGGGVDLTSAATAHLLGSTYAAALNCSATDVRRCSSSTMPRAHEMATCSCTASRTPPWRTCRAPSTPPHSASTPGARSSSTA